jgi:hypothetical protein
MPLLNMTMFVETMPYIGLIRKYRVGTSQVWNIVVLVIPVRMWFKKFLFCFTVCDICSFPFPCNVVSFSKKKAGV